MASRADPATLQASPYISRAGPIPVRTSKQTDKEYLAALTKYFTDDLRRYPENEAESYMRVLKVKAEFEKLAKHIADLQPDEAARQAAIATAVILVESTRLALNEAATNDANAKAALTAATGKIKRNSNVPARGKALSETAAIASATALAHQAAAEAHRQAVIALNKATEREYTKRHDPGVVKACEQMALGYVFDSGQFEFDNITFGPSAALHLSKEQCMEFLDCDEQYAPKDGCYVVGVLFETPDKRSGQGYTDVQFAAFFITDHPQMQRRIVSQSDRCKKYFRTDAGPSDYVQMNEMQVSAIIFERHVRFVVQVGEKSLNFSFGACM